MSEAVGAKEAGAGRPLRMLLLLGLAFGVWVMLRLPILGRDVAVAGGAVVPAVPVSPVRLVSAAGDSVAVAEARVAVAEAELALAQARLQLVRVQNGGAFVPPAVASVPVYAPVPPPYRVVYPAPERALRGPAVPDYGYVLPRKPVVSVADAGASPLPLRPERSLITLSSVLSSAGKDQLSRSPFTSDTAAGKRQAMRAAVSE